MSLTITQGTAVGAQNQASLSFAKSESKVVGAQGKAMDMIKKYALRAAGWLKVPTFLSVIYAAFNNPADQFNPYRLVAGALMLSTVLILALYGKKKDGTELTEEQKAKAEELEQKGLLGEVEKVFHFKDYPVEAAGGIGIVGSGFTLLSGLIGAPSLVLSEALIAPFAIAASVFLWISRDKKEPAEDATKTAESKSESLTFAKSESQMVGGTNGLSKFIKEEIMGKPVRTASILFLGASAMQLTTGFNLFGMGNGGTDLGFIMAGIFSSISNVLTLLFVRKSDYNIEQGEEEKQPETKTEKPRAKVKEARDVEPILADDLALGVT